MIFHTPTNCPSFSASSCTSFCRSTFKTRTWFSPTFSSVSSQIASTSYCITSSSTSSNGARSQSGQELQLKTINGEFNLVLQRFSNRSSVSVLHDVRRNFPLYFCFKNLLGILGWWTNLLTENAHTLYMYMHLIYYCRLVAWVSARLGSLHSLGNPRNACARHGVVGLRSRGHTRWWV